MKAYDRRSDPKSREKLLRGLPIRNESGSTITRGSLVYVSSWSESYKRWLVTLADANVSGRSNALFVIRNPITTNQNGVGWKTMRHVAQNTSAASAVGDPVYLSTTAGGWTLTAPYASGGVNQIVGRVAVDHASLGEIEFNLELALPDSSNVELAGFQISGLSGEAEGAALRIGTAAAPLSQDTVNTAFVSGNFVNDATSGSTMGLRITLDVGGALQTYSTAIHGQLNVTAQVRNPVAVQGDMAFSAGSFIQGLGYGVGTYITLPGSAESTGTFACMNAEINAPTSYSGGASPVMAVWRCAIGGDATALVNLNDNLDFMSIQGVTEGTGNMFSAGADVAAAATLRILVNTTAYYILLGAGESN